MLIQATGEKVNAVGVNQVVDFHVDSKNTQHIVYMMVNMYKDPAMAVCRELMANAADEHAKFNVQRKFQVTLPALLNPNFIVRDFAEGLSEPDVYRLITGIGTSGDYKRQDVNTTGGFGIGAKCPATITDQWSVTSYYQGTKTVYSAFKDEHGALKLAKLGSTPTDESGLEVNVPIKNQYIYGFAETFGNAVKAYEPEEQPEVFNGKIPVVNKSIAGTNWYLSNENYYGASLIINRVAYPIERGQFKGEADPLRLLDKGLRILVVDEADKAMVSVTPSREGLIYTDAVKKLIIKMISQVTAELWDVIQNKITAAPNLVAAYGVRDDIPGNFNNVLEKILENKPFTYKGKKISFIYYLNFSDAINANERKDINALLKLSNLNDTYFAGSIGRVVQRHSKSKVNQTTLINTNTPLPTTKNVAWVINDISKHWHSTSHRMVNHLREHGYGPVGGSQTPYNGVVLINDVPGVIDYLESFYPGFKDSFIGKLSALEQWLEKKPPVVRTPRIKNTSTGAVVVQSADSVTAVTMPYATMAVVEYDAATHTIMQPKEGVALKDALKWDDVIYATVNDLSDLRKDRNWWKDENTQHGVHCLPGVSMMNAFKTLKALPSLLIKPYKFVVVKRTQRLNPKWISLMDYFKQNVSSYFRDNKDMLQQLVDYNFGHKIAKEKSRWDVYGNHGSLTYVTAFLTIQQIAKTSTSHSAVVKYVRKLADKLETMHTTNWDGKYKPFSQALYDIDYFLPMLHLTVSKWLGITEEKWLGLKPSFNIKNAVDNLLQSNHIINALVPMKMMAHDAYVKAAMESLIQNL